MVVTRANTIVLLGLTAAASLLVCSSALPTSIPYEPTTNSLEYDTDSYSQNNFENKNQNPAQDLTTRKPSSFHRSLSVSDLEYFPLTSSIQPLELDVTTYQLKNRRPHHHELEEIPSNESHSTRDQILHQCTTHFLELLGSDVSDRLVLQLSRLAMMLPVIGVETRAVMRSKVVQVMQQASSRLANYEAIRRVIRTAIDDAGLLPINDNYAITSDSRRGGRISRDSLAGTRRIQYTDSYYLDNKDIKELSDSEIDAGEDDFDNDSVWFKSPNAVKSPSLQFNQKNSDRFNSGVDESEIPVVAEVAMKAVLDYMSEILAPALVIHQLTEGIQSALHQINKARDLEQSRGYDRLDDDMDLGINALSSQNIPSLTENHHGLNHLSDDWIWSSSSTTQEGTVVVDINNEFDDSRGQDEDLWDKDMETHDWDDTGHLFEEFEELESKDDDTGSKSRNSGETEALDSIQEDEDDDDNFQNSFVIGIQEEDDQQEALDDMMSEGEYYEYNDRRILDFSKQPYLDRFWKRSLPEDDFSKEDSKDPITSSALTLSKRSDSASLMRLWPEFAPDLRLESLLAQLIEPVLNSFIDEDFPASCKRAQGELMDEIIWSLDQAESSMSDDNEDQLVLLSELEY
ncbi:hypothetical protein BGZ46_000263 [Entomortierella lignicola]|nr:hypothetical protein BGZ46_000263 [Entomortierella lignicola]